MTLEIPYQDGFSVLLKQLIVPAAMPECVSVVLDIDAFQTDLNITDDREAWNKLERLRELKNEVFEACITNQTRRLFA